ncbi:MAG: hypothetical protein JHC61_09790 [Burkholderiaceae bacterium]|nr:hypothetical protein [Burkholderiaceae bacterium]
MKTYLFSPVVIAVLALSASGAWAQVPSASSAASPAFSKGAPGLGEASSAFRYPESGSQPSSTLRVREISVPGSGGTAAPAPVLVTDTQASLEEYQRCQLVGTRAATSNADMQGRIAQCLAELEARRRAGQ